MNSLKDVSSNFGQLIRKINNRINLGHRYEDILDFMFDSLSSVIPYDRIGVAILEENNILRCIWVKSNMPTRHLIKNFSAPLSESLERVLRSQQPRIINDLPKYLLDHPNSKYSKMAIEDGVRSSLTCPIKSRGRAVGFVFFSSASTNTYEKVHVDTYLEIAEELSVVVQQGRLWDFFEKNKSKDQLLRTTIHDLKSPLGVIQGFVETLYDEPWFDELDSQSKEIFSILLKNTKFMFGLIDDLAENNGLTNDQSALKISRVDLSAFVAQMITQSELLAAQKNIKVCSTIAPNLPDCVEFDPIMIRRAIDNLVTNAIKYSYSESEIEISINSLNEELLFSVKDNGQGIPTEEIPKLFSEFGKTSVRPTAGETSTGLGLAITKKIIEQHGGQINVKSQVGLGSEFQFSLPLARTMH